MFYKFVFLMLITFFSFLDANFLKDIKSFSANFEQTITNADGKIITYKGSLLIKEPNYILWRYKEPIIKNVYVLEDYAIIDEPELEQAIISQLDKEIDIITLLKKAEKIDNSLYVANVYDVKYKLYQKKSLLDKIEYKDSLENSIKIEFFDQVNNLNIDDEEFKFIPPNHYDVIRK